MRKSPRASLAAAVALGLSLATALAAACGGAKPKPESPIVEEGSAVSDTCCCKSVPLAAEDAAAAYEPTNRMECSSKQGTCVDDVQCRDHAAP